MKSFLDKKTAPSSDFFDKKTAPSSDFYIKIQRHLSSPIGNNAELKSSIKSLITNH
jgi:hypothetical protein